MTVGLEFQGNNTAPAYLTTPDFFARLQRDSATQVSLQNYKGAVVEINAERVAIGSAGFTLLNTANLITAAGADSGGAPAVTTLYYVYVSNSKATFAALGIRLSATAPSLLNGVKYLAAAGNGANWRFVGWIRTISNGGTVNFADSITQRLVINYYNRLDVQLFSSPGYVDDAAGSGFTEANNNVWHELHAATGDAHLDFISNGEDAIHAEAVIDVIPTVPASDLILAGIGTSTTTALREAFQPYTALLSISEGPLITRLLFIPLEGFRQLFQLIVVFAGVGGVSIASDDSRSGGTADPPLTYISAIVKG